MPVAKIATPFFPSSRPIKGANNAASNLKPLKPLPPIAVNQISLPVKLNPFLLQKRKFARLVLPARSLLPVSEETADEAVGCYAAMAGL